MANTVAKVITSLLLLRKERTEQQEQQQQQQHVRCVTCWLVD